MAKSVRISDELYLLAATRAQLTHRSLAQQIEHWVALGQAIESSPDIAERAALENLHAIDRDRVRRGRKPAKSLHMIPRRIAREAEVIFPDDAFAER